MTTFLWEEAKHTEFFRRVLDETIQVSDDLHTFRSVNAEPEAAPNNRDLFGEELPQQMNLLLTDPSPVNQVRASVLYNMIIEGVLAETGYQSFFRVLTATNSMPGLKQGLRLIQRDESRHIAYGVFLISRLVAEDKSLWPIVEDRMNELFGRVASDQQRNGTPEITRDYAKQQFQKRLNRIKRALNQSPEQVEQTADTEEELAEE